MSPTALVVLAMTAALDRLLHELLPLQRWAKMAEMATVNASADVRHQQRTV